MTDPQRRQSDSELIAAVKRGERIHTQFSLHAEAKSPCILDRQNVNCRWRTIVCDDSGEDVVECSRCGAQRIAVCNFDEEFS